MKHSRDHFLETGIIFLTIVIFFLTGTSEIFLSVFSSMKNNSLTEHFLCAMPGNQAGESLLQLSLYVLWWGFFSNCGINLS